MTLIGTGISGKADTRTPQIQMIFSDRQPIECTIMSVWEDSWVCSEVERTGRQQLVVADYGQVSA